MKRHSILAILMGLALMGPAPQASAEEGQRYSFLFPRTSYDRPDEATGPLVHFVYMVSSDRPDRRLDELGVIEDSARSINRWTRNQTDGQRWRYDEYTLQVSPTETRTVMDVSVITGYTEAEFGSHPQGVLSRFGLDSPNKRYVLYVEAAYGTTCGSQQLPTPYAVVFLLSGSPCTGTLAPNASTPSFVEHTAVHELVHSLGHVATGAPHRCLNQAHICTPGSPPDLDPERYDVMYPQPNYPLSMKILDIRRDDYYGHLAPRIDLQDSPFLTPYVPCTLCDFAAD